MRSIVASWMIGIGVFSTCLESAVAQPPVELKKDETPPPPPAPEAKPYVPDDGKVTVSYALGLLVTLMILLLVCMPARRD